MYLYLITQLSPFGEGLTSHHLNKFETPLHKNDFCQIWLILAYGLEEDEKITTTVKKTTTTAAMIDN